MIGIVPTFVFDGQYGRRPVALAGMAPFHHAPIPENIIERLKLGCYCQHDQDRTATLKKRAVAGAVSVYLQCDACGRAIGSAMSRKDHPRWQDYPVWDDTLIDCYNQQTKARSVALREAMHADMARTQESHAERAAEYAEWCRTSPEWKYISEKVAWRSRGWCEACLNASATQVHHLTYEFGKLPPAWHLKAVCSECHTRLHTFDDYWCEIGMGKIYAEDDATG